MTGRAIPLGPALLAAACAAALAGCGRAEQPAQQSTPQPAALSAAIPEKSTMQLTSPAFGANQTIPQQYTCDGAGTSPPLRWSVPPANTRSFALVVEDPDSPKGIFRHWGVFDLPAETHELAEGAGAKAAAGLKQTKNDFGNTGYGAPCPPKGDQPHHYHFRLLALDLANLPDTPTKAKDILDATKGHVLGSAELVGLYGRQ